MNETLIDKAESELGHRPLVSLDNILDYVREIPRNSNSRVLQKVLPIYYEAMLRSAEIDISSYDRPITYEAIFDQTLNQRVRKVVAVSLLRLLSVNSLPFDHRTFRVKAFTLFDEVFSESLYKFLNIKESDQTFEKQRKLEGSIVEIEEELNSLVIPMNDVIILPTIRKKFMQLINGPLCMNIITPFLPRQLLSARLDNIFLLIEEYLREESPKSIQLLETACENLHKYSSEAKEFGTKYSISYLSGLAEILISLISDHFNNNPMSKSTSMVAEVVGKKYPLGIKDNTFDISFSIINLGPGYAFDATVKIETPQELIIESNEKYLGHLEPGNMFVEFTVKSMEATDQVRVPVKMAWSNFNGSTGNSESLITLIRQKINIEWEQLEKMDPFSLEPVTTESELVGRSEVLNRLVARIKTKSMGSSYIHGQKRVGKTSIVKTLESRIKNTMPDIKVIYLEGGDYIQASPENTVENLGKIICNDLNISDPRIRPLELPSFDAALAPLGEHLRLIQSIIPDFKLLIILDEFDELPDELYKTGPTGDSFFLTIRSISQKQSFSFILVGGEKIPHIISYQGEKLNKFESIRVDYFDKKEYWTDFQALITNPVDKWLEISEDALVALYDATNGHPYFTKLICGSLFMLMVQRRDSHVTQKEVKEAIQLTLKHLAANSFKHFWDDDIIGENREYVSVQRRKVLISFSETARVQSGLTIEASREEIAIRAKEFGINDTDLDACLKDLVNREVLIINNEKYTTKIQLFGLWLIENGIKEIIATLPAEDPVLVEKRRREEQSISSEDIVELTSKWRIYRGRAITEDKVRAWLHQFDTIENQKLMLNILQSVTFYGRDIVRQKMKEANGIVIRGIVQYIEEGRRRRRRDIIVSYLDQIGKSGAQYAKLYAEENYISQENVIERGKLATFLNRNEHVKALVFVDDFVGTGNSACDYFNTLNEECGDFLRTGKIKVYFIAICGYASAISIIEHTILKLQLPIDIHFCDILDETAKCFSKESSVFSNQADSVRAKGIASSYGSRLRKRLPLGYGDCQATIVFEDSCPNNTLPILWDKSSGWIPIFERL